MNSFYVYEHWRPDTGACFYVGKGKRSRAWHLYHRSKWHNNILAKLERAGLSLDVRIIAEGLSNEEAVALEIERIAFYGRANLVNLTDGGEGPIGRIVSEETRAKIARAVTGKKHSAETREKLSALWKGTKQGPRSAEWRANLSAANKLRFSDPVLRKQIGDRERGKPRSPEVRAKIAASLMGNIPWNKGTVFTSEQKARLSIRTQFKPGNQTWNKGRKTGPLSPEVRAAMSATRRGVPRPPEVVAKIAASHRLRKARLTFTPAAIAEMAYA